MQGTMGFLTWVVLAELFPLKIRGLSMDLGLFMWIMNAIVSYLFCITSRTWFRSGILNFAVINYLAIVFVVVIARNIKQIIRAIRRRALINVIITYWWCEYT